MKKNILLFVLLFTACLSANAQEKSSIIQWKLGMQAYTFHEFTFAETLDKLQELGIHYVEVYFGQPLGKGLDGEMSYTMDATTRKKVLQMAQAKDVKIVACGVVICDTHEQWNQLFEFAKSMGIKTITSEPALNDLDYVGQLADQYDVDVAIHNHPKPSVYWNPEVLITAVEGKSSHFGSCADVGHWKRMGVDPVAALKKCSGKVKMLHFKDVENGEAESHDVIFGTGVCNEDAILKELKHQNFKGVLSIEYEYHSDNPTPDLKEFIRNYNKTVQSLGKS